MRLLLLFAALAAAVSASSRVRKEDNRVPLGSDAPWVSLTDTVSADAGAATSLAEAKDWAVVLMRTDRASEAAALLRDADHRWPGDGECHCLLSRALLQQYAATGEARLLKRSFALARNGLDAAYKTGECHEAMGLALEAMAGVEEDEETREDYATRSLSYLQRAVRFEGDNARFRAELQRVEDRDEL